MKNNKRAKRRFQTEKIIEKRIPYLKRIWGMDISLSQLGRCKKLHPYNCGNSHCICCNYEKIYGIPSHKERVEKLNLKDKMDDMYGK
jgi:hypothetical protein